MIHRLGSVASKLTFEKTDKRNICIVTIDEAKLSKEAGCFQQSEIKQVYTLLHVWDKNDPYYQYWISREIKS